MARPEKSCSEKLTRTISIRLTEEDYQNWALKVKNSGISTSDFFRIAILGNRTRITAVKPISWEKEKLVYLFNKASNNINQIAYRLNSDNLKGIITEITYRSVLLQLYGISQIFKKEIHNAD